MKIGEIISVTTKYRTTSEETKRRIDITIQEVTYIMGIATERIEINCTMHDLVKTLSKEEWEWVENGPQRS